MKFVKIGYGEIKINGGKKMINLRLDKNAQYDILEGDFERKMWLFETKDGYDVMCVLPDRYVYSGENRQVGLFKKANMV